MARRNETSWELSEIRTILNRAKTARDDIVWRTYWGNIVCDQASWNDKGGDNEMYDWYPHPATGNHNYDRDAQDMYDALTLTIDALERWAGNRKWKSR